MVVIITLFYLSLATIVGMVSWKLVSLRALKLSLIEGIEKELHGKLYEAIHRAWHVFRVGVLARVRVFTLALFYTVAHEVLHLSFIAGQRLRVRHRKLFDMVEGKGVIRKKGSVSFFLQDVAEYKKQLTTNQSMSKSFRPSRESTDSESADSQQTTGDNS